MNTNGRGEDWSANPFRIKGLPPQFREWISSFCRANGVNERHLLVAFVWAVEAEKIGLGDLGRFLEEAVRRMDGEVRYNSSPCPWKTRRHVPGYLGVWVRKHNGETENHASPEAVEAPH